MEARLSLAGTRAGMRQGELRGAMQNLDQLCNVVGPSSRIGPSQELILRTKKYLLCESLWKI
jgi:hypothetical protein